jgi:leucyl aminopeptidase
MDFSAKSGTPEKQRSGALIIGVYQRRKLSAAAQHVDQATGGALSTVLRRGDMDGRLGHTLLMHNLPNIPSERVLLIGCGKEKEFTDKAFREVTHLATAQIQRTGTTEATSYLTELEIRGRDVPWKVRQSIEISEAALYKFNQLKSTKKDEEEKRVLRKMILAVPKRSDLAAAESAIIQGKAIADGVALARDLGNLPGNICTPSYLAERAQELAQNRAIKTTILEESDMRELGMGALLSVSRGSRQPPKLIIMEYHGAKNDEAPVILVGKGLTFDAGGISLKPAAQMDEMKYDMCGAASVFGAMQAAMHMELPINLIGIIPSCENLPDGNANKPGDIVTSMSGQTIEVLNTDAEGRLILCDALCYAERYKPAMVVDIATLTGACVIALGAHANGLMGNNESLIRELLGAGKYTYDRAWQLPIWDDYQQQLDTNFADMANIGGREGGAITAACFLSRFTKKYKWAHLDIAGTAWHSGKEKGATGRPVPLLSQFLISRADKLTNH